jgi:hypothetical protein
MLKFVAQYRESWVKMRLKKKKKMPREGKAAVLQQNFS